MKLITTQLNDNDCYFMLYFSFGKYLPDGTPNGVGF